MGTIPSLVRGLASERWIRACAERVRYRSAGESMRGQWTTARGVVVRELCRECVGGVPGSEPRTEPSAAS
jgi:hypothetical protein